MAVAASARNALKIIRCTANKKLSSAKNHVKTIASTFLSPSITVKHFASVGKLLTSIIQFLIDNNSGDIPSFEGLFLPTHHKQQPYHRQKRAKNVSDGLNPPKHTKPLPDTKKCVRKRLSAFPTSKRHTPWIFQQRPGNTLKLSSGSLLEKSGDIPPPGGDFF
ncbi:hypothetical protein P6C68_005569, partial [Escherichia coli]|nr:hypothetical protein [Escherichia coli]EFB8530915.1 hypothetical protein [Escherichia coli]EFC4625722.1 hypothetical protein [Escherichia coli]EFC5768176.1 hypothetical protein [Escherichia coli]EFC6393103.1 hypothetical protein [Escherichia coli]